MAVDWDTKELERRLRPAVMAGVIDTVEAISEEGSASIRNGPKTGRIYTRRGVDHRASAPGQPPASDTGALVQSADTRYDAKELSGSAVWRAAHALPLELGTERIAPRPFARPALAKIAPSAPERIAARIEAALK